MKHMRELCIYKGFRIVEELDDIFTYEDLEGDMFDPEVSGISEEQLKIEQKRFRAKIDQDGVFGYSLERWDPEIGKGWSHVDSCWGFVGEYNSESNRHYIVDEFLNTIDHEIVGKLKGEKT